MEERQTDENSVMTCEAGESLLDDLLLFFVFLMSCFLRKTIPKSCYSAFIPALHRLLLFLKAKS